MTPEQLKILNDSILNIQLFCKSQDCCDSYMRDCPMRDNCNSYPINWHIIKEGDNNGK